MKKKILTFLCIFLTTILYPQNVSILSGPEFKNKNGVFKYIIGEDNTSFYVYRLESKGMGVQNNIEKCDKKTFAVEWVKDISFESDLGDIAKVPFQRSTIVLFEGKIYSFLSILHSKKNSRSVYAKSMDCKTGDVLGKAELLAFEDNYRLTALLGVTFSPDTTKVLIYDRTATKARLIELKSNKELFTKDLPESDDKGELDCTSVSADNKGNLLCIYRRKKGNSGIGKIAFNSTELKTFDLNIEVNDHAYLDANILQYDDNYNYAFITGVFKDIPCEKIKNCVQKGGNFYMKVDLNHLKVVLAKYEYFDETMQTIYNDCRDGRYTDSKCIGSIIDPTNQDVYSMTEIASGQIIFVTRFDKSGKVVWTKALPRNSRWNDGLFYAFEKGTLFFIFLDNPKNMEAITDINNFEVKKIKDDYNVGNTNIICMSITKEGELKRNLIGKNEKKKPNLLLQYILNLSEQPPILNLQKGAKEQYIRFEFQK